MSWTPGPVEGFNNLTLAQDQARERAKLRRMFEEGMVDFEAGRDFPPPLWPTPIVGDEQCVDRVEVEISRR
jgi:hypothetical protein